MYKKDELQKHFTIKTPEEFNIGRITAAVTLAGGRDVVMLRSGVSSLIIMRESALSRLEKLPNNVLNFEVARGGISWGYMGFSYGVSRGWFRFSFPGDEEFKSRLPYGLNCYPLTDVEGELRNIVNLSNGLEPAGRTANGYRVSFHAFNLCLKDSQNV